MEEVSRFPALAVARTDTHSRDRAVVCRRTSSGLQGDWQIDIRRVNVCSTQAAQSTQGLHCLDKHAAKAPAGKGHRSPDN
jgi:hypothetical protein